MPASRAGGCQTALKCRSVCASRTASTNVVANFFSMEWLENSADVDYFLGAHVALFILGFFFRFIDCSDQKLAFLGSSPVEVSLLTRPSSEVSWHRINECAKLW